MSSHQSLCHRCHGILLIVGSTCGECLWWHEDFLLRESVDVFGEGAQGDFPQDLEGSPSLLVELGTSPEAWEDQGFSPLDSAVGDSSV